MLCMSQLNLSARAYHRILKLARTIADLAGSESIQTPHLADCFTSHAPGEGAAVQAEGDDAIGRDKL